MMPNVTQSPIASIPPSDQIRTRLREVTAEADVLRKLLRASERKERVLQSTKATDRPVEVVHD